MRAITTRRLRAYWPLLACSLLASACGDNANKSKTDASVEVALFCGDGIFSAEEDCDKAIVPGHTGGCGLVGDLNYSGDVDAEDVRIVTTNVGTGGIGDIDGDGKIDSSDIDRVTDLLGADERSICGMSGRPFYRECALECFEHVGDEMPTAVREFTCAPDAVTGLEVLFESADSGTSFAIRPTASPCQYDFVRVDGATEETLSSAPGGYLVGGSSAAGDAVCVSNIVHVSAPDAPVMENAEGRLMTKVSVQCAFLVDGTWSPLVDVVTPTGDWAAWALGVERDPDNAGQFRIYYSHDFTWQFATLDDRNRPADDGIYEIVYQADSANIQELSTSKFRDTIVAPEDDITVGGGFDETLGPNSLN